MTGITRSPLVVRLKLFPVELFSDVDGDSARTKTLPLVLAAIVGERIVIGFVTLPMIPLLVVTVTAEPDVLTTPVVWVIEPTPSAFRVTPVLAVFESVALRLALRVMLPFDPASVMRETLEPVTAPLTSMLP